MSGQRFTLNGSDRLEAEIADILRRAGDVICSRVAAGERRTLALIGGYGRGEGGVERRGAIERIHNNLDLLLVLERPPRPGLQGELDAALEPLRARHEVGIDLGVITARALRRSPCLVMWYDARHGHRTVRGDPGFLPSLRHLTSEAILPDDVRDLLVNRGTLLVINDAVLERGTPDQARRRALLRHAAKAIIGYGDALLFFRGGYHWSYAEKRRRMAAQSGVPEGFRRLYDEACAFRFEPDYERFASRGLADWSGETRQRLAEVHLACEAARLAAPGLRWEEHPGRTLRDALAPGGLHPRLWLRKARNGLRFRPPSPEALGRRERLGLRLGGPRGLLAATFPVVAYGVGGEPGRDFARQVLGAASTGAAELRRAYLRRWGDSGDANFKHVVGRLGLVLEDGPAPAPPNVEALSG
jgi:hypothetical protein